MTLTPARRSGRPQPGSDADDDRLVSTRAVMISAVSTAVGVIAGVGAGLPAALAVAADSQSETLPIIVGILSGLAAAVLAGLTVAAGLHALVRNR